MQDIRALITAGRDEEARQALSAAIAARQDAPGGHAEEARLAEELGLAAAAVRAWQLALRDDAGDLAAWMALAALHEERGEAARAANCREQVRKLGGAASEPPAPVPPEPPLPGPSDADLVRFVHTFAGREDVHARMWSDPQRGVGYSPVQGPLTPELARAHLEGSITAGVYLVRHDDTVGFFVLDLDASRGALDRAAGDAARTLDLRGAIHAEGLRLLAAARALGLAPLFEDSGYKGRHLWCFLPEPMPASAIHRMGERLRAALRPSNSMLQLEFFPKQGSVGPGGLGNLVKLPLGLHLKSGRRSQILDDRGEPALDPFALLRGIQRPELGGLAGLPEPPAAAPSSRAEPARPAVVATPERGWTEADFETHPELGPLLRSCPVLREIVRGALHERALSREASVVVNHTLGHLPCGPRAANYLYDRIPGFPVEARMGAPNRGSPTSCTKVRSKLPEIIGRVPCTCVFPDRPGQYAHPLRHLDSLADPAPTPAPTLDELLQAYTRQIDRVKQVQEEEQALRQAAVAALSRVPGGRWPVNGGEWQLGEDGGFPVLHWVAKEVV